MQQDSKIFFHLAICNDGGGGLNQIQYIIKGMIRGMGLHLVFKISKVGGQKNGHS